MEGKHFEKIVSWRFRLVFGLFLLLAVIILTRIFYISVIKHDDYSAIADRQHRLREVLPARRGSIFFQDRFGNEKIAAFSSDTYDLSVSPKSIKDPLDVAHKLAVLFNKIPADYLPKLQKPDDPFEIVEKNVSVEMADAIDEAKIPTLSFLPSTQRIYPGRRLGASVLGFIGYKDNDVTGLYGIEKKFQKEMTGTSGLFEGDKDASGFWVALGQRNVQNAVNGSDLVLTVDYNIQERLAAELSKVKEKWGADSGLAVVIEPKTGKILALATDPDFDPNEYFKEKNYQVFKNPAVESTYELGSVMKPVTMAAGMYTGVLNPDTKYEDSGKVKIGSYTIQNFDQQAHGVNTMTQVLEKSLNTGAVFAGRLVGKENFKKYISGFGFGSLLGTDLPGEVPGNISNLNFNRDIDYATASFGQGIAATPLQMASAMGAIANNGKLMRPYIVEKIRNPDGEEAVTTPEVIRQAIRPETSETLSKMLVSVVRNGFEGHAIIKGYFIAAKTGTAQISSNDRKGYTGEFIHTFIGYAPAFNPRFLIYVQLNKPRGNIFAANTLTTTFHTLTEYLLNYFEVPPDEPLK
ncbi:MAG: hypothetical protein A3H69_01180 [Candidatus Sungbacteria bacterium RIFCSPLOWO2_02_FULL_47_9]|nr:MAG: hypothetical protein A3H69_01180 [Candidatus Sungbacteria bacterium RIFCSPLOWO2_02_FULL_47_9]